jgi:hypothetical protein
MAAPRRRRPPSRPRSRASGRRTRRCCGGTARWRRTGGRRSRPHRRSTSSRSADDTTGCVGLKILRNLLHLPRLETTGARTTPSGTPSGLTRRLREGPCAAGPETTTRPAAAGAEAGEGWRRPVAAASSRDWARERGLPETRSTSESTSGFEQFAVEPFTPLFRFLADSYRDGDDAREQGQLRRPIRGRGRGAVVAGRGRGSVGGDVAGGGLTGRAWEGGRGKRRDDEKYVSAFIFFSPFFP